MNRTKGAAPLAAQTSFFPLSLLVLVAGILPRQAAGSVFVGNPEIAVRVAGGTGIAIDAVTFDQATPRLDFCPATALNGGAPLELHGAALTLPIDACSVGMETGGLVTIEGHGVGIGGGTFELQLDLEEVVRTLATPEEIWADPTTSKAFILLLGEPGWITATSLGLSQGQHVVIDTNHSLHDGLVSAVESESHLFRDDDGDGVLDGTEVSAGPLD